MVNGRGLTDGLAYGRVSSHGEGLVLLASPNEVPKGLVLRKGSLERKIKCSCQGNNVF